MPVPPAVDATRRAGGAPRAHYTDRRALFTGRSERLGATSARLSHVRTAAFVFILAAGLWLERGGGGPALLVLGVAVVAFVALVVAHRRVRARQEWCRDVIALNEEGIARLERRWDRLPVRTPTRSTASHAYAEDLDLFGSASLVQILGPADSPVGASTLDDWLLERARPDVVAARQEAVRELAPLHELREALAIHGRRTRAVRFRDIERFLQWAEQPGTRVVSAGLHALAWLLPAATWLLILLHAIGAIGSALWLLPMMASFAAWMVTGAASRRTFDAAFGREGMFSAFPELLQVAGATRFEAPALRGITARLNSYDEPAHRQIARLRRLMHLADIRFSLVHIPVYVLTMWDVHVLRAVERWRSRAGTGVRDWLAATGELEALCALATLAHDQPGWCFGEFATAPVVLEVEALGHPLIADDARVGNDVQVGPPGTFLLVTGSNMSGKSTLLRAIGLNAVLAQAGAPSCARRLRMPELDVRTSIRVQDSLARGVSYFMAELERLKQIVDAAQAAAAMDVTLLFLLDEILHGTNTAERRIAARRVIRHLVASGAIGAATTHDLELADEPVLRPHARLVHFQEHFSDDEHGSRLEFDYRLRQGLATSTNALELMRLVGLPGEAAEQSGQR